MDRDSNICVFSLTDDWEGSLLIPGSMERRDEAGELLFGLDLVPPGASSFEDGDEVGRPFSSFPSRELEDWRLCIPTRVGSGS